VCVRRACECVRAPVSACVCIVCVFVNFLFVV